MLKFLLIIFIFSFSIVFAQQTTDSLKTIRKYFESFEYSKVINEANKLLEKKGSIKENEVIEIYRMKGISLFSMNKDDSAKSSFVNILSIDPGYQLDTNKTSPKIVTFFNQIKKNYVVKANQPKQNVIVKTDTLYIPRYYVDITAEKELRLSIAKSMIFPGWGHFAMGYKDKGLLFSSLTVLALTSTIYFIMDANKKKKDYYAETDVTKILSKYNDYNQAYLKENISIVALALIWAYTQFDLLFISSETNPPIYGGNLPILQYNNQKGIQVSYKFSF
jgi:hypothetical protein